MPLPVTVDDSGERRGQIGLRINGIELAGFDERSDGRPVFCPSIMPCEECVLPIEGDGTVSDDLSIGLNFSIIHGIEHFPDEEYVRKIVSLVENFDDYDMEWFSTIHIRIFNSDDCFDIYKGCLEFSSANTKSRFIAFIERFKTEFCDKRDDDDIIIKANRLLDAARAA